MTSEHSFEVGGRYKNRDGAYEVLSIEGTRMRIRYEDGKEQTVTVGYQAWILQDMQDEAGTAPAPQHSPSSGSRKTQAIGDLVRTVLSTRFSFPYAEDITDQICLAIEAEPDWQARYDSLVEEFSKRTVNTSIARYICIETGMGTFGAKSQKAASGLIKSYSPLRPTRPIS